MTVDNFEQIKSMLVFDSEDDFYHLQILKRKKENPDLGSNSYVVKTYYVSSVEYLESKRAEIINLCQFNNARACINLNRRSFEKMAFNTMKKIADQIMNRDFKSVRKAYESACGAHSNESDKKWLLDIDWADFLMDGDGLEEQRNKLVNDVTTRVQHFIRETGKDDTIWTVQTRNGVHLITRPFDPRLFAQEWPQIVIQKNNPTILYI